MKSLRRYLMACQLQTRRRSPSSIRSQRGVSLVIALLMLLVLTVIGLSALNTSNFEANIAGNERLYNLAFYNSDAGVDFFYGTGSDYLATPNTMGVIDSQTLTNLNLNNGQFNVTWRDTGGGQIGPPLTKEFLVTSEGIAPNFPTAGRVTVEAVIEVVEGNSQPQYQGGST